MTSTELRQARAGEIANARKVQDLADTEKRELKAEEQEKFDKHLAEADRLRGEIEKVERRERLDLSEAELRQSTGRKTAPNTPASGAPAQEDYDESFRAWALQGTDRAPNDADTQVRAANCGIRLGNKTLALRALSKGTATAGGHTVPVNLSDQIVEKLAFFNPIRQRAQSLVTDTGADLDYPRVDDTANGATIIAENGTIATNADPSFDKVTMKAWKYATTIVLVSIELLADSAVNVPTLLARLLAKRMARGQRTHFVTGDGTTQPQGLATLAVVANNLITANPLTGDKIIDLIYALDRDYREGASFLMHDETVAAIVKLKDTTNQYLWQPGLQDGQPDRLKGYPVDVSNDLTSINSPGDNQKLILFGNIEENYLVRDVRGSMQMTRLSELYAATGQVGFNLLMRTDGRGIAHAGWLKSLNTFDV